MAKLKQALARYQARNALAENKTKKLNHLKAMQERKREAQAARTRKMQKNQPAWLPFDDFPQETVYLLIGEGDFSFAAAFTEKYPLNRVIASSLDSAEEVAAKYPETGVKNCEKLKESGCEIVHNLDATQLLKSKFIKNLGAHKENQLTVIFNFPHLGNSVADQDRNIRQHQELLLAFFTQCMQLGALRVLVTLFDGMPYEAWQPKHLARTAGYSLVRTGRFPWEAFPNYNHQLTSKVGHTHKEQKQRNARMYLWEKKDKSQEKNEKKDDSGSDED